MGSQFGLCRARDPRARSPGVGKPSILVLAGRAPAGQVDVRHRSLASARVGTKRAHRWIQQTCTRCGCAAARPGWPTRGTPGDGAGVDRSDRRPAGPAVPTHAGSGAADRGGATPRGRASRSARGARAPVAPPRRTAGEEAGGRDVLLDPVGLHGRRPVAGGVDGDDVTRYFLARLLLPTFFLVSVQLATPDRASVATQRRRRRALVGLAVLHPTDGDGRRDQVDVDRPGAGRVGAAVLGGDRPGDRLTGTRRRSAAPVRGTARSVASRGWCR